MWIIIILLYSLPESPVPNVQVHPTASATASECRVPASSSSAVESNVSESALQSRVILVFTWCRCRGAGAGGWPGVGVFRHFRAVP